MIRDDNQQVHYIIIQTRAQVSWDSTLNVVILACLSFCVYTLQLFILHFTILLNWLCHQLYYTGELIYMSGILRWTKERTYVSICGNNKLKPSTMSNLVTIWTSAIRGIAGGVMTKCHRYIGINFVNYAGIIKSIIRMSWHL